VVVACSIAPQVPCTSGRRLGSSAPARSDHPRFRRSHLCHRSRLRIRRFGSTRSVKSPRPDVCVHAAVDAGPEIVDATLHGATAASGQSAKPIAHASVPLPRGPSGPPGGPPHPGPPSSIVTCRTPSHSATFPAQAQDAHQLPAHCDPTHERPNPPWPSCVRYSYNPTARRRCVSAAIGGAPALRSRSSRARSIHRPNRLRGGGAQEPRALSPPSTA
jgi:hypothetical protein